MKKLLIILLLLVGGFSFSQEKKKSLDERINTSLDSLSKLYGKKVYAFGHVSYRGVKESYIRYIEDGKEIKKVTKVEILSTPKKED
jgi:hypothetical protein